MKKVLNLDGQKLQLLDKSNLDSKELHDIGLSAVEDLILSKLSRTKEYDEISFGFNHELMLPMIYILVNLDDVFYRVHLENVKCAFCGNVYLIGNPFVADSFIGVQEKQKAMRKAVPKLKPCPNCENELSRPAIWIKPL